VAFSLDRSAFGTGSRVSGGRLDSFAASIEEARAWTIGDRGSFIDADGGIEWLPIPVLAIRVGYRYFYGKGENDGDEAKVELTGPYASLTLAF
jgi:hypothetical protein